MLKRAGFLTGLLLFSFLAGVVPHAAGQASTVCGTASLTCQTTTAVTITPPTQPLKPLGAFIAIPIQVTYEYESTASVSLAATPIELRVTSAPSWVVTTLSPTTIYASVSQVSDNTGGPQKRVATQQAFLLVSATADAPAFQQGNIEIQADARDNGALIASSARNAIPVQADFFSIIEAVTETTIQRAKPQAQVVYPVTVTNFGNALTKVEFLIDAVPDKWQVTPPSPVTLESKQAGGTKNSRTANVVIQTPFQNGYMNVVGAITVRLRSTYALDPKVVGDSTIVSTLTTTKGFYVPGPDPMMMLMVLGLVAVGLQTWNRDGGEERRGAGFLGRRKGGR